MNKNIEGAGNFIEMADAILKEMGILLRLNFPAVPWNEIAAAATIGLPIQVSDDLFTFASRVLQHTCFKAHPNTDGTYTDNLAIVLRRHHDCIAAEYRGHIGKFGISKDLAPISDRITAGLASLEIVLNGTSGEKSSKFLKIYLELHDAYFALIDQVGLQRDETRCDECGFRDDNLTLSIPQEQDNLVSFLLPLTLEDFQVLIPGMPVPAGCCPLCGGFCYPVSE